MAQLGVAALNKGWAIPSFGSLTVHPCTTPACEPRLDLSHSCSPECIDTYGLVSQWTPLKLAGSRESTHVESWSGNIHHHPRSRGFTLLELLIAITIFAIIATFVYSGLKVILDTEHQTSRYSQRIAKLQLGLNIMQRDIEQLVGRPVRDQYGDQQPALKSSGLSGILLELTRDGYANPMQLSRSNLQRVGYVYEEDTLYRLSWPVLDSPSGSEPLRQKLFGDITSVELVFYDKALQEKRQWPPRATGGDDEDPRALPVSIELKMELKDWGTIRRLFRAQQPVPAKAESE